MPPAVCLRSVQAQGTVTDESSTPAAAVQPGAVSDLQARSREALRRGLAWLARSQRARGAWVCDVGIKLNSTYEVYSSVVDQDDVGGGHVGVSALACLAFVRSGSLPGRGEYARTVEKGLEYVLSCVKEDGYITDCRTDLYSHAFATIFLAEIYGATKRQDILEKLWLAIDVIAKGQSPSGGWRYLPFMQGADLSVTTCQLMALHAAIRNGVEVPKPTVDRAIRYVRSCAVKDGNLRGGFRYLNVETARTRVTFPLTATAVAVLQDFAVPAGDEIRAGIDFLERAARIEPEHFYFFYGHYYASRVMRTAGGLHWSWYRARVQQDLLAAQHPDGSWEDNVGPAFATAMATLILQTAD